MIEGVTLRLRKGMNDGNDPFDVFNSVQDHVLLAAQAHIDALVFDAFANAVESIEGKATRSLLSSVCDLHALSQMERERAWFLEHGRFTATRSKSVTTTVNELCERLRPYAELLVDAFGIPDEVIAAPIALGEEAERQRVKARHDGVELDDQEEPAG